MFYSFFNFDTRRGVGGHCHTTATLSTGKRPGSRCAGGWVGRSAGLDGRGESRPHRDLIPDCPAHIDLVY